MANKDRMTIYMTEHDKETVQRLMDELAKRGVDVNDNRNKPSTAKMIRLLVQQELERLQASPK